MSNKPGIVFMGTPDFAAQSLSRLYDDGFHITGVFTQPDKPRGRGNLVTQSPVKIMAAGHDTPVFQPDSMNSGEAAAALSGLSCDLIAVVAYGKLLPRAILNVPSFGCINIHGSLLPKYRGAAPVQWAVLNGETETGVTSIYMSDKLDQGDIIMSRKTKIGEDETAQELYNRLGGLGAGLLSETISAALSGDAVGVPQNDLDATYAPALSKDMSKIDWTRTAYEVKCKVRGLTPWPVACATLRDTQLKIFSVVISKNKPGKEPGDIITADKNGIEVACSDGTVIIKELQAPGGKRMLASDYLRGHPLS